jgi:hypothetical protein
MDGGARGGFWLFVLIGQLLACSGSVQARSGGVRSVQGSIIEYVDTSSLGEQVDYLGRAFWGRGRNDIDGFGYYVYLVFRTEASRRQKLLAAEAFLAHPEGLDFARFDSRIESKRIALLVAPVQSSDDVPKSAEMLVHDYDLVAATVITERVSHLAQVPAVALVAYPTRITLNAELKAESLLVVDACGDERDVRVRLAQVRETIFRGQKQSQFLELAERLGRLFTSFTTHPCQTEPAVGR